MDLVSCAVAWLTFGVAIFLKIVLLVDTWRSWWSAAFALLICLTGQAEAHFGMIIPSTSTVMEKKDASLTLDVSFSHPMEMQGMDMQRPKALTVTVDGKTEDLCILAQAGFHHRASGLAGGV